LSPLLQPRDRFKMPCLLVLLRAYRESATMTAKLYANRPFGWRTVLPTKVENRKQIVDNCLVLSMKELFQKGLVANNAFQRGAWRWANARILQFNGVIRYEADLRDHGAATLRLQYEIDGLEADHCLLLSSAEQGWLGPAWWFHCPLENIRVKKLYLPPDARRFASRQAHNLIYPASRRRRPIEDCRLTVLETKKVASCGFAARAAEEG